MTDKEKAKAYDEALERARKQKYDYQKEFDKTDKNSQLAEILRAGICAIELAFPELAESEDERIRKELANFLRSPFIKENLTDEKVAPWIAYLEKQKEQKPANGVDYDISLTTNDEPSKLKAVGNVYDNIHNAMEQKPAEWSEEDERMLSRCVKSIESSKQFADADTFKKAKDNEIDWLENRLKSFRPVKQEWSEEDEKNRRNLMSLLANMRGDRITEETYQKYYPWLKDLRPSWKPSEEQIKALYCALNDAISLYSDKVSPLYEEISRTHFDALESLYNDLKKL